MKIQINATGKFEDVPLKIAQRMINKGIAHIVKKIDIKPKVKIRKRKTKKEKTIESQTTEKKKLTSKDISGWRNSGDTG